MKQRDERSLRIWSAMFAGAALLVAGALMTVAAAPPVPNIRDTPHNLSRNALVNPNNPLTVRAPAGGEDQVCAFCHTPHNANTAISGPLWNRSASNATYTRYTSSSMDANYILEGFSNQPAGSSLLCLSCHDGMVALGNVNALSGKSLTISLDNTENGKMPAGTGALTGFTRQLGTDLTNDHPISVTYNDALASMDGELTRMTSNAPTARDAVTGNILGLRSSGFKPLLPLEPTGPGGTGQVQCATCHDPHLKADKFLRLNRFQTMTPMGSTFNENSDQICLACHPKLNRVWAESAHANPIVADEPYLDAAATRRNFPTLPTPIKVWQAACLNCHDTHTVQGARRLLREGVDSALGGTGAGSYRFGSAITPADTTSSIENTCYQCHDVAGSPTRAIGTAAGSTVPEIRAEFSRAIRMPIATAEQLRNKREVHDIVDADFMESAELLGKNNAENRHVECTDCHNPHRLRRASTFYGTSATTGEGAKRTHNAGGTAAMKGADGNVASGVLRGTWGVEPKFGSTSSTWPQLPLQLVVKKGDPGMNTSIDKNKTYLTREYQLCFKCHSNYSNSDVMTAFPPLGNTLGGTTGSGAQRNYLTRYTNVAAEFGSVRATDPPTSGTDQGEVGNDPLFTPNASPPSAGDKNHRSWHPVMWPTGRTASERAGVGNTFSNIRAPFNTQANIGYQTMQCSDCHGDPGSWTQNVGPNVTGTPPPAQGPHGSSKKYLLKGDWNIGESGNTPSSPGFCGNCHNPTGGAGGFRNGDASHSMSDKSGAPCNFCHIAVPHGWKNKAFLVNLNCVGTEAGLAPGCTSVPTNYTVPPYYVSARLKVTTWQSSNAWTETSCFNGEGGMSSACGN